MVYKEWIDKMGLTKEDGEFLKMSDDIADKIDAKGRSLSDEIRKNNIIIEESRIEIEGKSLDIAYDKALKYFNEDYFVTALMNKDDNNEYKICLVKIKELIDNDEEINPDTLTDQEKKEFFMYSYSLIKHLFPKATESLYPIRIEEISTFDMLDDLGKWVEDHGNDLLPYLKRFRQHEETKQGYNVELFQVYSLIASIGYGVRILTDSYGDKWAIAVNGIRAARIEMKKCRFVNIPDIVENAYQFSITYQPKDKNKYIIKLLLDMGLSRNAIKKLSLPIKGDDKTSKESYDNIIFPLLPIDLEE